MSTETTNAVEPDSTERPKREKSPLGLRHLIAVSIITALLASTGTAFASHQFPDVPDGHQFHDEIDWMADTGVTTGFPDGTYRPGEPVTRGSMAAFMLRLYNLMSGTTSVDTGTDGGSADTNTGTWQTVTGASNTIVVPAGTTGRIITTFSGDMFCNGGDNIFVLVLAVRPQCLGRINVAGAAVPISLPAEVSLADSDDANLSPDNIIDSAGFSLTATSGILGPGTYTITAQINTADNDPTTDPVTYEINDHILTSRLALSDRIFL
jgi:hypothetical protein